jgi:hypothetical protein
VDATPRVGVLQLYAPRDGGALQSFPIGRQPSV